MSLELQRLAKHHSCAPSLITDSINDSSETDEIQRVWRPENLALEKPSTAKKIATFVSKTFKSLFKSKQESSIA